MHPNIMCKRSVLVHWFTGPVCSLNPVSRAPVSGLKEFPQTGGFSMRERRELPSWTPGQSIIPANMRTSHWQNTVIIIFLGIVIFYAKNLLITICEIDFQ